MDPYLAIASKRDERAYADTPVGDDVRERILDAGRLTGSSKNRQRWEFVVVSGEARERLAEAVYAPENVRTAALVVAIVGEAGGFDAGRCAQNMMLAAWGDGVVSSPNGARDPVLRLPGAASRCGRPKRGGMVGAREPQAALGAGAGSPLTVGGAARGLADESVEEAARVHVEADPYRRRRAGVQPEHPAAGAGQAAARGMAVRDQRTAMR